MNTAPLCRFCRKRLRPYPCRELHWAKEKGLEWGYYGDGYFCNGTCARHYAVRHVRENVELKRINQ